MASDMMERLALQAYSIEEFESIKPELVERGLILFFPRLIDIPKDKKRAWITKIFPECEYITFAVSGDGILLMSTKEAVAKWAKLPKIYIDSDMVKVESWKSTSKVKLQYRYPFNKIQVEEDQD